MSDTDLQTELTDALIETYRQAGRETGYWGNRSLQAIRKQGGLIVAKQLLNNSPGKEQQRPKGLEAMLQANRPDLTMEATILQDRFKPLFTENELKIARQRLGEYSKRAAEHQANRERLHPDELEPGQYAEGARKRIWVNAYERDSRARRDCLKAYGYACAVCGIVLEQVYGELGKGFIHVHHLKPLALCEQEYTLNGVDDLRPVCPNCHAMLHRPDKVLSIEELKARMAKQQPSPTASD